MAAALTVNAGVVSGVSMTSVAAALGAAIRQASRGAVEHRCGRHGWRQIAVNKGGRREFGASV